MSAAADAPDIAALRTKYPAAFTAQRKTRLRAGLVVAIAIPLVLAITFLVMQITDISLQRISLGALIIALGAGLTLANNIMSYSFHAYQQELFPTGIRARAAGFVYSWSRLSVIFSSFVIAWLLENFGATGVFIFISGAMIVVATTIGLFGPRTSRISLERISH